MKKSNLMLALGAALLLAAIAEATWQTADAATPAVGRDIVVDRDGNFIRLAR